MAGKKDSSNSTGVKRVQAPVRPAARSAPSAAAALTAGSDASSRQWMREAAWSRMFGRTETKNPFTR